MARDAGPRITSIEIPWCRPEFGRLRLTNTRVRSAKPMRGQVTATHSRSRPFAAMRRRTHVPFPACSQPPTVHLRPLMAHSRPSTVDSRPFATHSRPFTVDSGALTGIRGNAPARARTIPGPFTAIHGRSRLYTASHGLTRPICGHLPSIPGHSRPIHGRSPSIQGHSRAFAVIH